MEVRVKNIVAQCARCTGSEFEAMRPDAAAMMQVELECTHCGYRYTRARSADTASMRSEWMEARAGIEPAYTALQAAA
jgi:DNA-directed RNA polymerase subunit RPC12/RpoP